MVAVKRERRPYFQREHQAVLLASRSSAVSVTANRVRAPISDMGSLTHGCAGQRKPGLHLVMANRLPDPTLADKNCGSLLGYRRCHSRCAPILPRSVCENTCNRPTTEVTVRGLIDSKE